MAVTEMRMLHWMSSKTINDRIRNEDILSKVGISAMENKKGERRLRWFGHVQRRPKDAPVRRSELLDIRELKRGRGRLLKTWSQVIQKDMSVRDLDETIALNRNEWRKNIQAHD